MAIDKSNFKIISEKQIFISKNFKIEKKIIERNGKQITKDFIIWNPIVYILPITPNNEVYLEHQFRDAYQKTMLEVVGGHAKPEEDLLQAAKRELQEETGLTADKWQKMCLIHPSANIFSDIHVFIASGLHKGNSKLDEDEEINMVKLPLKTILEKIMNNEIEIGNHQAVLLKLDKLIKEGKIIL